MAELTCMRLNRARALLLASGALIAQPAFAQEPAAAPEAATQAQGAPPAASGPEVPPSTAAPETAPTELDPVAQAAATSGEDAGEVVVLGARATQRTSNELKRNSSVIVDGLVSDEIGATPDNSVGDTLERIAGVTADRFKGNANELSVRGLGPTLSFSTFNGREVSSAGGDRSVAFQQFPSELVNGVLVYKSQQADFVEGGVGGVIELRSLKPLDSKRRLQMEVRGDYQPKDDDVIGHDGLGYRANISYTDKFKTGIGDIGISLGYQRQDTSAPEDYYNTNSIFQPCNTSANAPATSANNCVIATTPRAGETITAAPYFATTSRAFRTQKTKEQRDAFIGALQWRPSANLEIAFDGQYSKRRSFEDRNILAIVEGLRGIQPITVGNGTNGYSEGALISYRGNSNLENQLEARQRNERYIGGGSTITWRNDRLTLVADGSYSGSHRTETQKATRMRSNRRVGYTLSYLEDDVVPTVQFDNFDITDPSLFAFSGTGANTAVYARNRFATDRRDEIWAGRLDASYNLDGFFTSIKVGGRYSDHHRTNDNARNNDLNTLPGTNAQAVALIAQANQNCRAPFTTSSYMDGQGTNVTRWATFNNDCLFRTFAGSDEALPYPADGRDPSDINVRERLSAVYAMANFRSELGDVPFSGNIGVRYIDARITSKGYRLPYLVTINSGTSEYVVVADPSGTINQTEAKGKYRYWLPSANIAFDLTSQLKLRLAAYRAIARSGIEDLGAGIAITPTPGRGDIVLNATTGNPNLKPLRAWNADASIELYASKDTVLSIAGYYKWARGTVISATTPIPTDIDINVRTDNGPITPRTITINPVAPTNDTELRRLYGVEISGSHAFTWLPSPLDGFGISGTFNRAVANFEYPDPSLLGAVNPATGQPYIGPENLIGLSKYTASGSVYWEKYGFSLRASLRYRSSYFKPNSNTNRSVQPGTYVNLSAQYNATKNLQFKLQALNVTGTKDVFYKGGFDSITEVSNSGPQYYFGIRLRY